MTSWDGIVDNLLRRGQSSGFKSIEQYYKDEIYHQYNLHLMNRTNIDGKIKYQWFFENH